MVNGGGDILIRFHWGDLHVNISNLTLQPIDMVPIENQLQNLVREIIVYINLPLMI